MSRVRLALRVADLEGSIAEPPRKLVLVESKADETTRLDHLGVKVASTAESRSRPPPR